MYSCETSDSVTAYINTNGQKEWIGDYCGNELPPRIMSNGHRLTIEFKSLDYSGHPHHTYQQSSAHKTPPSSFSSSSYPKFSLDSAKGKYHANSRPDNKKQIDETSVEADEYDEEEEEGNGGGGGGNRNADTDYGRLSSYRDKSETKPTSVDTSINRQRAKGFLATYRFITSK